MSRHFLRTTGRLLDCRNVLTNSLQKSSRFYKKKNLEANTIDRLIKLLGPLHSITTSYTVNEKERPYISL